MPKDQRLKSIKVPCGRCEECRKREANDWKQRLFEELKDQKQKSYFITLTVSNECMEEYRDLSDNALMAELITKWRKRMYKAGLKERHFIATEKGQECTERIHAHGILWTDDDIEAIGNLWRAGWFDIGEKGVNENSVAYIVKYIQKPDEKHDEFKSKIFASKGLGVNFVKKNMDKYRRSSVTTYRTPRGHRVALCEYYMKKIYTDEEREDLRLEKMDKKKLYAKGLEYDATIEEDVKKYIEKILYETQNAKKCMRPRKKTPNKFEKFKKDMYICNKEIEEVYETERSLQKFIEKFRGTDE